MQRVAKISGLLLCAALLFGAGVALGLTLVPKPAPVSAQPDHDLVVKESNTAASVGESQRETSVVATTDSAPVSSRAMERLRLLIELNRRLVNKLGIPLRSVKGRGLHDEWVRAFDVSPDERKKLEALMDGALEDLNRAAAKVAQVSAQSDGTCTISVPAYPTEGGAIYDRFVADFTGVLGPERTGYMRELNQLDDAMFYSRDQFGIVSTIYRINLSPGAQDYTYSSNHDPGTGASTAIIQLDLAGFRREAPLIYEKMVAAGQLPEISRP